MNLHDALKAIKILAVMLYVSGSIGVAISRNTDDRQRNAHYMAIPGFGLVWGLGVLLTWQSAVNVFSTWIVGSMLASLVSINGVLYRTGKEERGGFVPSAIIIVPLALCVVLMTLKPE
jgi:hypothetical protein